MKQAFNQAIVQLFEWIRNSQHSQSFASIKTFLRNPNSHTHFNNRKIMSSSALSFVNGGVLLSARPQSSAYFHASAAFKWGLQREQDVRLFPRRIRGQEIRVLANPNASSGQENSKKEIVMVDPLEAKRLAAKQMEQIKAKERFKKRRKIEAINGAWAMIGLTAGLVIEGQTGKSILDQLAGYWAALVGFFIR